LGSGGTIIKLKLKGASAAEAWRRAGPDLPRERAFATIGPDGGFSADYVERPIGEILVADVRCGPLLLRERRAPSEAGAPHTVLQAVVEGQPVYHTADGETISLRPGRLVIRRQEPGAELRCERPARVVTVFIAQHLLAPRFTTMAALSGFTLLSDDAMAQRLLYGFVVGLADGDGAPAGARAAAIDVLGGLLSMVLAQLPQPPEPLSELTARRAADALSYLKRNFANPHLTPAIMAEDLGISTRYCHKLMGMTGRSFRHELINLRLAAARAAFAANGRPRQTIADIAISVGFNDLSQFNRHFRAAYGMTPRAARKLDEASRPPPDEGGSGDGDHPPTRRSPVRASVASRYADTAGG
jgi:AraC-like DNA-binding protein